MEEDQKRNSSALTKLEGKVAVSALIKFVIIILVLPVVYFATTVVVPKVQVQFDQKIRADIKEGRESFSGTKQFVCSSRDFHHPYESPFACELSDVLRQTWSLFLLFILFGLLNIMSVFGTPFFLIALVGILFFLYYFLFKWELRKREHLKNKFL